MAEKRQIHMTPHTQAQLSPLEQRARGAQDKKRKTYTDRLDDLTAIADTLAEEIKTADADIGKRLTWLKDYARILPLLERAERRHAVQVDRRAVEDLTDSELSQAVRELQQSRVNKVVGVSSADRPRRD